MGRLKTLKPRLRAAPPRLAGSQVTATGGRRKAQPGKSFYDRAAWRDPVTGLRIRTLKRDGWMCQGCPVPHPLTGAPNTPDAPIVDHIKPHRGDRARFFDPDNVHAVCKAWHDSAKQRRDHQT